MKIKSPESSALSVCVAVPVLLALNACAPSGPNQSGYMAGVGPVQRQVSNGPHHPPPAVHDDISYWEGDDVMGSPLIRINRREQKAYFYKGGRLVGVSAISSGREDKGTPAGNYKITQKNKDHRSNIYGVFKSKTTHETIDDHVDIREKQVPPDAYFVAAPMPNFMRFNGAIGLHTGYLPGYPASGGCIRMPHHMSTKFFENVEIGTPVVVE